MVGRLKVEIEEIAGGLRWPPWRARARDLLDSLALNVALEP